jgi:diaminopimelate decarboxylase
MSHLPVHVEIDGYTVVDNCLCIDGRKLTDIVASTQGTPLYIYGRSLIRRRVDELRRALPERIKIHYAIKANPMPEVVQLLAGLVDGLDVASLGELEQALRCQLPPLGISFAGPGKRDVELRAAIGAGIVINVESASELQRIVRLAREQHARARIAIRVNPSFELKSSGMKMSGGPKPFGIDSEAVPEVLSELARLPVDFRGFHIFSGSQNLRAEAICEAQTKSVRLALDLAASAGVRAEFLNIGGGFGIPYFPGDRPLSMEPIGANLRDLLALVDRESPGTELVIELGRYLVGEAGIYVCAVVDKKNSRGHTYLITDGGMHHHLAASGNFGQVIRKNYPVLVGNNVSGQVREDVTVAGPLCTPLDVLAANMTLPEASVGDLIVVMQSGAYGFTASPRGFLSHPEPGEVLV